MKNKEFWKGAVAGALVMACISVGAYVGADLADKGYDTWMTVNVHRNWTYLENMIDEYYLGDKDEEKLTGRTLYRTPLRYWMIHILSYYTAEEYESENSSSQGSYVGIGILMEKNKEGGVKIVKCYEGGPGEDSRTGRRRRYQCD